jgi:hypothetical protein
MSRVPKQNTTLERFNRVKAALCSIQFDAKLIKGALNSRRILPKGHFDWCSSTITLPTLTITAAELVLVLVSQGRGPADIRRRYFREQSRNSLVRIATRQKEMWSSLNNPNAQAPRAGVEPPGGLAESQHIAEPVRARTQRWFRFAACTVTDERGISLSVGAAAFDQVFGKAALD